MKKSLLLCVTLAFLSIGASFASRPTTKEIIMDKVADGGSTPRSLPTRVTVEFDDSANALILKVLSTKSDVALVTITNASGEVCGFAAVATNGTEAAINLHTASYGAQVYTITIDVASEKWSGILSL